MRVLFGVTYKSQKIKNYIYTDLVENLFPSSSILMMCHYPDLGSDSDWSCGKRNLLQPIRSTTQIRVVTHHQYESLHSFLRWHFTGPPRVASHLFLGYLARRKQKDLEFTEKCFWNFVTPRNKGIHNYIWGELNRMWW